MLKEKIGVTLEARSAQKVGPPLDRFMGTWTADEEAEFLKAVEVFEQVDDSPGDEDPPRHVMNEGSDTKKQAVISYPASLPPAPQAVGQRVRPRAAIPGSGQAIRAGAPLLGKAARLTEMSRVSFLHELDRIGVSAINLRDEEVEAEIRAARELAG